MENLHTFLNESITTKLGNILRLTEREKEELNNLTKNAEGSSGDIWRLESEKENNTIYYKYYTEKLVKRGQTPQQLWNDKYRIIKLWCPLLHEIIEDRIRRDYKCIDRWDNVEVFRAKSSIVENFYDNAGTRVYNVDEIVFSEPVEFILSSAQLKAILRGYKNNIFDL